MFLLLIIIFHVIVVISIGFTFGGKSLRTTIEQFYFHGVKLTF